MTLKNTDQNSIIVFGKVSRASGLKYTPAGQAILEFTLAVPQSYFEKRTNGYFEAVLTGVLAEDRAQEVRIGKSFLVEGSLWTRTYQNRQGAKVNETKIIVSKLGGQGEENGQKRR